MKGNSILPPLLTVLFLPLSLSQNLPANEAVAQLSNPQSEIQNPKLDKTEFAQKTMKLYMPFIANKGQMDERVKFYANTFGGTVFVTKDGEIVYALPNNSSEQEAGRGGVTPPVQESEVRIQECLVELRSPNGISPLKRGTHPLIPSREGNGVCNATPIPNNKNETHPRPLLVERRNGVALKEEFVGARINSIHGEDASVTKVSYFKGKDSSKWKTNIPTYDAVNLGEIYDGIELKLRAYGNNVEKLFCVKPGASPDSIKIYLLGIEGLRVNKEGQLEADTELGPVKFTKPVAYQEIDGKRVEVDVEYSIQNPEVGRQRQELPNKKSVNYNRTRTNNPCSKHTGTGFVHATPMRNPKSAIQNLSSTSIGDRKFEYGFTVASYDRTNPLIIDPLLASTYLGGSGRDYGYSSLALDTSGNVYVTGETESTDFPTTSGAYDTSQNGRTYSDVFVSKLNSGLSSLLASTYLGGSYDDEVYSIVLDTSGNVYVTGETESTDFPTTSGAYDTSRNNKGDVFVSKLDSGLTSLLASTYLGGSYNEQGKAIVLDTRGNVYVTGDTQSSDFPMTSGAYHTSFNGGLDAFVSKLNSGLSSLLASTYLGGYSWDHGSSLTLDTSGNVYVMGETQSDDFPTTDFAYDRDQNGDVDVFVSKLNSGLSSLLVSTLLGVSGDNWSSSLTLDTSGNVYVTGYTESADFPTTSGAYDTSFNGGDTDVFVSKLDGGLSSLLASTFLGGSGNNWGPSLTLDTSGNVYVTGKTRSTDFPTTSGAYDTSNNGSSDVFVSKLDGELSSLLASTYLGGSNGDEVYGSPITLDARGNVYVTGYTSSTDFPTTSGAYDTSFNDSYGDDVFISKLDGNLSASITSTPTPTSTPTATKTPTPTSTATKTPTPTPTPTITPLGCKAVSIEASSNQLTLSKKASDEVTVTVTGDNGCPVQGDTVTASVNSTGKNVISVSPISATTDAGGEATFTITAKNKTGNATVTFKEGNSNLRTKVKVKVVK